MSGITLSPEEKNLFRIVAAIIQLGQGRNDATGSVTLTAGATSTFVAAVNCGKGAQVSLTPKTANAAAAVATTYIPTADVAQGGFTIRHANTGTTDRTFGWMALG